MVFMVHSRHVELLLTYRSQSTMIVNFEAAKINWYFQSSIVSLTLCKEYLKRQHSEYPSYS